MALEDIDIKILSRLQGDLPLVPHPYRVLAEELGISEAAFRERVKGLIDRGIIRRLGAVIRHRQAGVGGNAMVAWNPSEDELERVGQMFARYPQVTHCYLRTPQPGWPYQLYTMVHASRPAGCNELVKKMALCSGVPDYVVLHSIREMKKSSMKYFTSEE